MGPSPPRLASFSEEAPQRSDHGGRGEEAASARRGGRPREEPALPAAPPGLRPPDCETGDGRQPCGPSGAELRAHGAEARGTENDKGKLTAMAAWRAMGGWGGAGTRTPLAVHPPFNLILK